MSRITAPTLSTRGVSFRLPDGRTLFRDLTLGFEGGLTALVGPNGSGKSTLLALLAGILAPTAGDVVHQGRVGFLPQRPDRAPGGRVVDLMGFGEPFDAMRRLEAGTATPGDLARDLDRVGDLWDLPARIERALARVGLPPFAPGRSLDHLSGGEITRLALAGLVAREPEILLLDEPTNHLDAPARGAIEVLLRDWTGVAVVVTHDRALLRRADRIVELGAGAEPHLVRGGLGTWEAARARREEASAEAVRRADEARRTARREAAEARERQARRNAGGARGARVENMPKILLGARQRQAEQTTGRVNRQASQAQADAEAVARRAREAHHARERVAFAPGPSGLEPFHELLALEGVGVGAAEAPLFGPVSARWVGPVRVGVVGPNGSGKTTFLRVVAGQQAPDRGRVTPGRGLAGTGRLRQLDQLAPSPGPGTVLDAFRRAHPAVPEARAREVLDAFLFPRTRVRTPAARLSEGERTRLWLACALGGPSTPALLLLDEPTNHLDLDAVQALEAILRSFDGGLIVASHDPDFLEALGVTDWVHLEARPDGPSGGWSGT
jgi:ATPase subunit of ABC transporter with duplicated ATPase domains